LSKETIIGVGDGQEDVRAFNNLRTGLFDAIGPVGALEELLVDHMIMFQWRNLRVLRFEVASIRNQSDTAIEVWESEQASDPFRGISGEDWKSTEDIDLFAEIIKLELQALAQKDPIAARPDIWMMVFTVAGMITKEPIEALLGLDKPWGAWGAYSGY
jgi:hypothetical protein